MPDSEFTPTVNEVRADFVLFHTRNFDAYQVGRSLASEQEFYGDQFDRMIAAVEAAVRADQIERDAAIAAKRSALWLTQPATAKWADGEQMNLDSRFGAGFGAEIVAAAIRAQLNGDSNAE